MRNVIQKSNMGRGRRGSIYNMEFASRKAAKAHVQEIIHRARPGVPISGDDFAFMRALLEGHPRAEQKIGIGVASIWLSPNAIWQRTQSFHLRRIDGSETDFSYLKCLQPPSKEQEFRDACRRAIATDILRFKHAFFDKHADESGLVVCPLSGQLVGWTDVHVDHAPPWVFNRIVTEFIHQQGIDLEAIEICGHEDGAVERSFADDRVSSEFQAFHKAHACLRVIAKHENLSRSWTARGVTK